LAASTRRALASRAAVSSCWAPRARLVGRKAGRRCCRRGTRKSSGSRS
jgi:hypothetical protein